MSPEWWYSWAIRSTVVMDHMSLDLDIDYSPRTSGRAAVPVAAVVVREIVEADIVLLNEAPRGVKSPAIKRISERHHALARNLASGMKDAEAAFITGYDISRISILKADPTFQELMQFYRQDVDKKYLDLHERLSGLAKDAADELSARLEENPDALSTGQLIEITKMGADRTGHGPSSTTQVNLNVGLAARLEEARRRVASRVTTIEHED